MRYCAGRKRKTRNRDLNQVHLEPKTTRGLNQALNDVDAEYNYIITPGTDDYLMNEKTRVCCLMTFMEEYLPI